jgi:hypothetical protein
MQTRALVSSLLFSPFVHPFAFTDHLTFTTTPTTYHWLTSMTRYTTTTIYLIHIICSCLLFIVIDIIFKQQKTQKQEKDPKSTYTPHITSTNKQLTNKTSTF